MRRRHVFLIGLMFATASGAKEPVTESWGKPMVSFAAYRADAVACATHGYFRDVSQDAPAKRFISGWREADNGLNQPSINGPGTWVQAIQRTQPDRRRREIHAIQVGDVEQCLSARGYRKFSLTRAEERMLKRYPPGSASRHQYLHSLAARSR